MGCRRARTSSMSLPRLNVIFHARHAREGQTVMCSLHGLTLFSGTLNSFLLACWPWLTCLPAYTDKRSRPVSPSASHLSATLPGGPCVSTCFMPSKGLVLKVGESTPMREQHTRMKTWQDWLTTACCRTHSYMDTGEPGHTGLPSRHRIWHERFSTLGSGR